VCHTYGCSVAERPKAPTLAEAADSWRASRVDVVQQTAPARVRPRAPTELPDGTESEGERPSGPLRSWGERSAAVGSCVHYTSDATPNVTSYPPLRTRAQARSNNVANCA
jgi:hypothetical protein